MKKNDKPLITSAQLTLKFADGLTRSYEVTGPTSGDPETGFFQIDNENGSKFVFLPNPEFHTGKRKRRLEVLHNL